MKKQYYERIVKLPADWYKQDLGPFVATEKQSGKRVKLRRGIFGYCSRKKALTYEEFGIFKVPIISRDKMSGGKLIKSALGTRKGEVIGCYILSLLVSILAMVVPFASNSIINNVLLSENTGNYQIIVLSLLSVVAASVIINIVIGRIRARVQSNVAFVVFVNIIKRIMGMNSCDEKEISNKLIGRFLPFIGAVETVVGSLFSIAVYLLQSIILIAVIVAMNNENTLTKYGVGLVLLNIICSAILVKRADKYRHEEKEKRADFTNIGKETIDNMEAIKTADVEDVINRRMFASYVECFSTRLKLQNNNMLLTVLSTLFNGAGVLLIFLIADVVKQPEIGKVTIMVSMYALLMGYLTPLINSVTKLLVALPKLEFATMVLSKPCESDFCGEIVPELSGSIELSNIVFSYDRDTQPVINDLSLSVTAGDYIGIVGMSGSGKSTLIRLLLGFERPDSGSVSFDGNNLEQCNLSELRKQFGTVLQNDSLISGTIAMNIGLSEHPDMEKVIRAAKTASIYEEVSKMPMGFNTIVSSESELLSGGEKQRVILARAIYNSPKILLLDEATSAMDNVTQKAVKENLDALNVTRIMVAHRLSTVKDCNRIIVLDEGKIVQSGTFDELLHQNGLFAAMAKRNL